MVELLPDKYPFPEWLIQDSRQLKSNAINYIYATYLFCVMFCSYEASSDLGKIREVVWVRNRHFASFQVYLCTIFSRSAYKWEAIEKRRVLATRIVQNGYIS